MPPDVRHYLNVANCSVERRLLPANACVCSTVVNLQAQSQKMVGSVARSPKLCMDMKHEQPVNIGLESFES